MKVHVIRESCELAALRARWERLPRPSPMQSLEWYLAWWTAYRGRGDELYVVTVMDAGELIAAAPWYSTSACGGRQLRCLGDGQTCSDHATVLCQPARRQEAAHRLAEWLVTEPDDQWQQLVMESIDVHDQSVGALVDALLSLGCPTIRRPETGSCYIDLPDTWDEFLASVSKNHRKRCRRWQRKFFDTARAHVQTTREPDPCVDALGILTRLHRDRRNSLGEPGAFEAPPFRAFHDCVVPTLAATNQLQLRTLHIDGAPVAAEYLLDDGRELFVYQSGLSVEGAELSAGNLSILALMRDAIAAGYRRIDFLRGTEPYKFRWGAKSLDARTHVVRRATTVGRLGAWSDIAWGQARRLKRRILNPA